MNFKLSEMKKLKSIVEDDFKEVVEEMIDEKSDFTVGNYRFILQSEIDQIMVEDLKQDEYLLGCFSDWFLADCLEIDVDVIKAMQKVEEFDAIGKLILSMGKIEELQEMYVSSDGYGQHFAGYDGNEEEFKNYYYFRVN